MSYDAKVLACARERFERQKRQHQEAFAARRDALYRRQPRLQEIEGELRAVMSRVIAAALRHSGDPVAQVKSAQQKSQSLIRERTELLAALDAPADAVTPAPRCPRCGDTGYRRDTNAMCACFQQLCIEEQNRQLSKLLDIGDQSFASFRLDVYDETPGDGETRSPYERMVQAKQICELYAGNFGQADNIRNLFFIGAPGLGKTFLSAAIAREVSQQGFSVVYDSAIHVFSQFETEKFLRGDEAAVEDAAGDARRYLACDLFILDDLGAELTTPFVREALYRVVNERLIHKRHTVINSNLERTEFESRYTPAIASRLRGEYQMIVFRGDDVRKKLGANRV